MMTRVKRFTSGVLTEFTINGVHQQIVPQAHLGQPRYKSPCIDPTTGKLKPESECAKKKDKLMEENKNEESFVLGKTTVSAGKPTMGATLEHLMEAQKRLAIKLAEKPQPKEQNDDTTGTG